MKTLKQFHNHVVKTAHLFTAVRFKGRGQFDRKEFKTLAQAIRYAELSYGDNRTMIYAVGENDHAVHIMNS
jgi:hypothetical protein